MKTLPVWACLLVLGAAAGCVTTNAGAAQVLPQSVVLDQDACNGQGMNQFRIERCQIKYRQIANEAKRKSAAEILPPFELGKAYAFLDVQNREMAVRLQQIDVAEKEAIAAEERRQAQIRADQLAAAVEAQNAEYEKLKNAGPNNSACIEAKQTIENIRTARRVSGVAANFVPGLAQMNQIADQASPALKAAEIAVRAYCFFDAVATGNARQAVFEAIGAYQSYTKTLPASLPRNAAAEQRILTLTKTLSGGSDDPRTNAGAQITCTAHANACGNGNGAACSCAAACNCAKRGDNSCSNNNKIRSLQDGYVCEY